MQNSKITLTKINHARFHVEAPIEVLRELKEFLSYEIPNFRHLPAYKKSKGKWDGRVSLLDGRTWTCAIGTYKLIEDFCKLHDNIKIFHENNTRYGYINTKKGIDPQDFAQWVETLCLPYEPYDYQMAAAWLALNNGVQTVKSPTGSGKSLIIYLIMRYLYEENKNSKHLLIVPTINLVNQMEGDFKDYSQYDESFDAEKNILKVFTGQPKFSEQKAFTFSTWQSAIKFTNLDRYASVIADEAHTAKSTSVQNILNGCTEAHTRVGTTGTLGDKKADQALVHSLLGKVWEAKKTSELQDEGKLSKLKISIHHLKYHPLDRKRAKNLKYADEIKFIINHRQRMDHVIRTILDCEGNTLVLYRYVKAHGYPLFDRIYSERNYSDRVQRTPNHSIGPEEIGETQLYKKNGIFFISGSTSADKRENVRSLVEQSSNAVIVASEGTFSTGINIKNIHNVVFASPMRSEIKVLQSIGRGLRVSSDGRDTRLIDFIDDITVGNRHNFAKQHAGHRLSLYTKEGFDFTIYEKSLESDKL